jgi:hypothetical protein
MQITTALMRIRDERAQSIVLRRDNSALAAQTMRVERISRGRLYRQEAGSERRADVTILAAADIDIAIGDRFNADGMLLRVSFIQPNRQYATLAEAEVVE